MALTVGEISPSDLHEMIDEIVEQKLRQLLSDPDEDLVLRDEIVTRLQKQRQAGQAGVRGYSLDAIMQRIESQ